MSTPDTLELKNQIKMTNIIFYSLLSGLLIFFAVVIVITRDMDNSGNADIDKIFLFIVPVSGFAIMLLSRMVYTQMISRFNSGGSIIQKIAYYRTAKIVSWAMIEGACFLALVATMLTSNYLYIVVFLFLIGYFILMRPSKESLIRDMRLNLEESDFLLKS
jgi:hypothetical protein